MDVWIWMNAFLLYVVFRLWYDGIKGPLSGEEVEQFMCILRKRVNDGLHTPDLSIMQAFMEADDGKEFVMVNMLTLVDSPATHPETGEQVEPSSLLTTYFQPFMKRMLKRAGHPVFTGRINGGYLDAMNTPENPGWHGAGLIRYRSRRDALQASLANSSFDSIYQFKTAAIEETFAIPVQRQIGFYASPRLTVGLALALGAALLQLALG